MSTATLSPLDPNKYWDEWPDVLGRTVRPGDWIVYGSSHGHLVLGTVESINKVDQFGTPITIPGDQCLWDLYSQTRDIQAYRDWNKSVQDGVTTPWASVTVIPRKYDATAAKNGNRRTLKNMSSMLRQDPPV